ncbi:MAG: tRNA 2-thiouridine(34) synthase MnmA, partial [Candidatus Omnitrophica bacterium]|nr:tRNA 2-thiouridine(34) synthase MnmA [Candidatus Omnitrophota bacterium]
EVRALARKFGLPVADKSDSQEICFLPDTDYRGFLKKHCGSKMRQGEVVDLDGNVLGGHKGIAYYTVGQREGLGIALGFPAYVIKIDALKNRLTVGAKENAEASEFVAKETNFIIKPLKKKIAASVKIRYNHKEMPADVWISGRKMKIKFKTAQFAVTPGQSAVLYDRDTVLGGGIIEKVVK